MLNHITIMGRLTKDPELRTTQSNVSVCSFTVACERDFSQGNDKITDFIECVAWRQGAEFVKNYFSKGSMIIVDGRLQSRKWVDRDNNNRTSWEIAVDHSYFGEAARRDDRAPMGTGVPSRVDASEFDNIAPGQMKPLTGPDKNNPFTQQTIDDLDDGELPF